MKIVDCVQGTELWFISRLGIPTASEFSRIVSPKQWKLATGRRSYIYELTAETRFPGDHIGGGYTNLDMDRGVYLEPEARRYVEFDQDIEIQQVGFCLTDDGRFGCSPDGLIGEDSGIEIKSPKDTTQLAYLDAGEVPAEYLAQCHGSMIVTGRKKWKFFSYCPGLPPLFLDLEWDEKTEALKEALEVFWSEYQAYKAKIDAMDSPLPTRTVDYGELGAVETTIHEPSYW